MPDEEQRNLLVGVAADAAGVALDRRHRSMLAEVIASTFIVALLVLLPVTLIVNGTTIDTAKRNAAGNCVLIGRLARIEAGFIGSDAHDRRGALTRAERLQVQSGFAKILAPRLIRDATRRQQRLDNDTIDYWQGPERRTGPYARQEPLLAQTRDLAAVNCARRVK